MEKIKIKEAASSEDYLKCWEALKELRPHLTKENYLDTMDQVAQSGYLLYYLDVEDRIVSVIGFRFLHLLYNGLQIYIDDLSTLPDYRGKGYANTLLNHVISLAKENKCKVVTLDSGFDRHNAHRLYLKMEFEISSLHFSRPL